MHLAGCASASRSPKSTMVPQLLQGPPAAPKRPLGLPSLGALHASDPGKLGRYEALLIKKTVLLSKILFIFDYAAFLPSLLSAIAGSVVKSYFYLLLKLIGRAFAFQVEPPQGSVLC